MSNHIDDLLSAYLDNELTDNERQQVKEHLNSCPRCSAVLSDIIDIKNQVYTVFHSIEAPETLEDTVMSGIRSGTLTSSNASQQRYWLLVLLFCPLLLLAVTIGLTGSFVIKFALVGFKIIINLIYAIGSILSSEPYIITGLIGFSLLLIITSSVLLKHLIKIKVM